MVVATPNAFIVKHPRLKTTRQRENTHRWRSEVVTMSVLTLRPAPARQGNVVLSSVNGGAFSSIEILAGRQAGSIHRRGLRGG